MEDWRLHLISLSITTRKPNNEQGKLLNVHRMSELEDRVEIRKRTSRVCASVVSGHTAQGENVDHYWNLIYTLLRLGWENLPTSCPCEVTFPTFLLVLIACTVLNNSLIAPPRKGALQKHEFEPRAREKWGVHISTRNYAAFSDKVFLKSDCEACGGWDEVRSCCFLGEAGAGRAEGRGARGPGAWRAESSPGLRGAGLRFGGFGVLEGGGERGAGHCALAPCTGCAEPASLGPRRAAGSAGPELRGAGGRRRAGGTGPWRARGECRAWRTRPRSAAEPSSEAAAPKPCAGAGEGAGLRAPWVPAPEARPRAGLWSTGRAGRPRGRATSPERPLQAGGFCVRGGRVSPARGRSAAQRGPGRASPPGRARAPPPGRGPEPGGARRSPAKPRERTEPRGLGCLPNFSKSARGSAGLGSELGREDSRDREEDPEDQEEDPEEEGPPHQRHRLPAARGRAMRGGR